ncbi:MAG: carbonic anhydrase [Oligoflexia bacterium]|nr:carbonic anhydrase [Oligoflexia bacterium]MBF0366765.1 carbonic anhydrase [Oligoflexia bacterium]
MAGNNRYVAMTPSLCKDTSVAIRKELANGQAPYAIILSCSDSRLPPEIIFDKSIGEIFVVRVAGNIPDPIILGSLEYAAEHLGSPLLMVLGHEKCGAVKATVDADGHAAGNIGQIVKKIAPAASKAKSDSKGKEKGEIVEMAVDNNINMVADSLTENSSILKHLVKEGKLKIVKGKYDLDDGKVTIMK